MKATDLKKPKTQQLDESFEEDFVPLYGIVPGTSEYLDMVKCLKRMKETNPDRHARILNLD